MQCTLPNNLRIILISVLMGDCYQILFVFSSLSSPLGILSWNLILLLYRKIAIELMTAMTSAACIQNGHISYFP